MDNEKLQEIMEKKQKIIQQLDEINNSISDEDIQNATAEDLLEFTKLTLEIKRELEIIETAEKLLK